MQHQTFTRDTSCQIEAKLDDDRKALTSALAALGAKFTPDALWSGGMSLIKTNRGPYTQAIDSAIRTNPVAVALTGIGLAWLILGRRAPLAAETCPRRDSVVEAVARWEDDGGPVAEILAATPDTDLGLDRAWIRDADNLRIRANALIAQIDTALRKNVAPAVQLKRHRADVMTALTKDVRRVMLCGLGHLPRDARDIALQNRMQTYATYLQPAKTAPRPFYDTPLTMGAAYVAAGAALAALLPQSSAELRALGPPRDQLVDSLQAALREERQHFAHTIDRIAQSLLKFS